MLRGKWMSEALNKSKPASSEDSPNAISSPALESGPTPLERLDGRMILPFGQAPAPARVSVQAGSGEALAISVTYGPHGSGSLASAALTQSLANRLRVKTDSLGSTLFRLIWKERDTPSGRRIPALRATGRRTSGRDCTSWPTPRKSDQAQGLAGNRAQINERGRVIRESGEDFGMALCDVVKLASWPTPNTPSGGPNTESTETHTGGRDLEGAVQLAGSKGDLMLPSQASLTATGAMPSGSGAATGSTGQLNPAHSRWLMGLPPAWDACAVTATHSMRSRPSRSSKHSGKHNEA